MGVWAIFKENRPWGYYDRYAEQKSNLDAAAGANFLNATAVPAGVVWVIKYAEIVNVNTNPAAVVIYAFGGAINIELLNVATPGANIIKHWEGELPLKEGDYMQGVLTGCTAGDDIYLRVWGYKMQV